MGDVKKCRGAKIESFWVANLIWTKVIAVKYSSSHQNAREARSVLRLLTRAQGVDGFDCIIPNHPGA